MAFLRHRNIFHMVLDSRRSNSTHENLANSRSYKGRCAFGPVASSTAIYIGLDVVRTRLGGREIYRCSGLDARAAYDRQYSNLRLIFSF